MKVKKYMRSRGIEMKHLTKKQLLLPLCVFVLGISISAFLIYENYSYQLKTIRHDAYAECQAKVGRLENEMNSYLQATDALELVVEDQKGVPRDFHTISERLVEENPAIRSIQLAPDGVISYVYPIKGNVSAMVDLFKDEDNKKIAEYTRDTGETTFQGPYTSATVENGIAIRNPIYLDEKGRAEYENQKTFWGFAIVIVDVPSVFHDSLQSLKDMGYDYYLEKNDPQTDQMKMVLSTTGISLPRDAVSAGFQTGGCVFRLYIRPDAGWGRRIGVGMAVLLLVLLSLLLAILTGLLLVLKNAADRFRNMSFTDALTGLDNRRGLLEELDHIRGTNAAYGILFLDLNHFKEINDTYGHDAGDCVLLEAAGRIAAAVAPDKAYRLGGDEFAILIKGDYSEGVYERKMARIRSHMKKIFTLHTETGDIKMPLSTSIGYARYPDDGEDADAVMEVADGRMYENKMEIHKREAEQKAQSGDQTI